MRWHKSSRSQDCGEECVEVAPLWRKSSRSLGNNEECVEVAGLAEAVLIRDSKDSTGPMHKVTSPAFRNLINKIKSGELDL
ncbi:DUF397 domain-containing protein [Actinomadura mexicana]|uniref:DUF397 domain-containing protein n=1 Tax=Actinomadura mexicana TaxID=134959 RepID=A0A238Y714_9ACTN|nr:DUF397 domain-containing protein [Actinomadura mexicana]SNR66374.1 protein of unknown function [Actinomadura mexicana]